MKVYYIKFPDGRESGTFETAEEAQKVIEAYKAATVEEEEIEEDV